MGRNQLSKNLLISRVCIEYDAHEPLVHYLEVPHCFRKLFWGLAGKNRRLVWALGGFRFEFPAEAEVWTRAVARASWTEFS